MRGLVPVSKLRSIEHAVASYHRRWIEERAGIGETKPPIQQAVIIAVPVALEAFVTGLVTAGAVLRDEEVAHRPRGLIIHDAPEQRHCPRALPGQRKMAR